MADSDSDKDENSDSSTDDSDNEVDFFTVLYNYLDMNALNH